MVITVKFIGALRYLSGKKELSVEYAPNCSLKDCITKISGEMPALKSSLLDSNTDDPKPNALILVNGKEISVLNGLETKIKNNDEIVFIPVVHGG